MGGCRLITYTSVYYMRQGERRSDKKVELIIGGGLCRNKNYASGAGNAWVR